MTAYKVVVDGSNIATEGRTSPSLTQLDEAVRAFVEEHPGADVYVVVDTSFPNKIDPADVPIFEAAYLAGEIITPPAGTIGRGDAFILKIADKMGATVFSNDSFQEFHGTYEWLFEKGRLVGGKPIPGLGWVFTPRTPVRGMKSREAVREAKRSRARIGSPEASRPMPVPKAPPPFLLKADEPAAAERSERSGKRRRGKRLREGVAEAGRTVAVPARLDPDRSEAAAPNGSADRKRKKRRRKGGGKGGEPRAVEAVNEPLSFVSFVAEHPIGAEVDGTVDAYSSHGFYVVVGSARGYVPLSGVSVPQPRAAKDVVRKGEDRTFVVRGFDPSRRGIELAIPGSPAAGDLLTNGAAESSDDDDRDDSGAPAPLPAGRRKKAVVTLTTDAAGEPAKPPRAKRGEKKQQAAPAATQTAATTATPVAAGAGAGSASTAPATAAIARRIPVKRPAGAKARAVKAVAEAAPVTKAATAKAPAAKAVGTKAAASSVTTAAKPATAKKAPVAAKGAAAKQVAAKKAPVAAKGAAARKAPAAAKRAAAAKAAAAKKAPAAAKRAAAAKGAAAKKVPSRKPTAK